MRRRVIAANWKMNTTAREADALAAVARDSEAAARVDIILCPPFVWLERVGRALDGSGVRLGAQNASSEEWGAYTGEVSPLQLAELCTHVIVGHSERRRLFGETDEVVCRKVRAVTEAGLTPILCVGEGEQQHARGESAPVVRQQLAAALGDAPPAALIVAYEPVWAIGSGTPATPEHADAVARAIGAELRSRDVDADSTPILYGGSVGADGLPGFLAQPHLDGALVGGASLDAATFAELVRIAAETPG